MKSRNPILPLDRYFPDGEPHWMNGELFVYPSCDEKLKRYCSDQLYVAHSRDLAEWSISGPAFALSQLDWAMAPGYPPGLAEATDYEKLPEYLRSYLPKVFRRHEAQIALASGFAFLRPRIDFVKYFSFIIE